MANINFVCEEEEYELFWKAKLELLGARGTWNEFFYQLLQEHRDKFSPLLRQKLGEEPAEPTE